MAARAACCRPTAVPRLTPVRNAGSKSAIPGRNAIETPLGLLPSSLLLRRWVLLEAEEKPSLPTCPCPCPRTGHNRCAHRQQRVWLQPRTAARTVPLALCLPALLPPVPGLPSELPRSEGLREPCGAGGCRGACSFPCRPGEGECWAQVKAWLSRAGHCQERCFEAQSGLLSGGGFLVHQGA